MNTKKYWFLTIFLSTLLGQTPFFLEDVNQNSETFGEIIGPSLHEGKVRVIFFGHES
jgi:hypothetical protein